MPVGYVADGFELFQFRYSVASKRIQIDELMIGGTWLPARVGRELLRKIEQGPVPGQE